MKFITASETPRPKRLSGKTRAFAYESMRGRYGEAAMETPYVSMDDVPGFEEMDLLTKYDAMVLKIAKEAPVRVCPAERISGSATLGAGIWHKVPAYFKGEAVFSSVSHLTVDFEKTLRYGAAVYEKEIRERLLDPALQKDEKRFLESLLNVYEALQIYHSRYLQATKEEKPETYELLLQVPFGPARNFHEAVQSLWFIFSFLRITGNWPGIGRIDMLLGDYLKKDLKEKKLTLPEAREILASFFIKGTEWIEKDTPISSGDAQHYQNIVLSGIDIDGKDLTNEVTYLVLDIIEELGISDFPVTVRVNSRTKERLLQKMARVIRHGGGVVAIYNEDLILKALTDYGYPLEEARLFANDGCWEVQIPGCTKFGYLPFDSLELLENRTLGGYAAEAPLYTSFEDLYRQYVSDLRARVSEKVEDSMNGYFRGETTYAFWPFRHDHPCSVVSLFENDCIKNARSYMNGGARYKIASPHIGGLADTVNSLYALKKFVFDEKRMALREFYDVLRDNFENDARTQRYLTTAYSYYGNDNDEVDEIAKRLLHDFYEICLSMNEQFADTGFKFPAGVSTFGREIEWRPFRLAAPEGAKKDRILAGNASPTPGTDSAGATAVIRSYTKADLSEMTTGTALDLRLFPRNLTGETGLSALVSLIRGFVELGGYFVQIDAVSPEILREAQAHPEDYKTLSVRVSGWNARFVTLTKEWQEMIIQKTEHGF